ncbi:MAG: hypothetical protein FJ146_01690 [Deltaproteobacteria bacterium]|nr:hypothetical protein [Deltaproteobacteria bacterium]
MKRWLRNILIILSMLAAPVATAYDYSARFNLGLYSIKEDLKNTGIAPVANDRFLGIGRAYVDVTNLTGSGLEFTVDLRNQYDPFGRIEPALGRMAASNDVQLRQLVLRSPATRTGVFWSIGRFVAADAVVLGNDGAEAGLRLNQSTRLALFGGLYPEHRGGRSLKIGLEERQIGGYAVYEESSKSGESNTYASTSLVGRKSLEGVGSFDNPAVRRGGSILVGNETAPTEADAASNYMFWYANAFRQRASGQRLTYISHIIVQPSVQVRNLWASLYQPWTSRLSGSANLFHLDLRSYQQFRDLLDRLPISGYSQLGGDLRYKLSNQFAIVGDTSYGRRDVDGKNQYGLGGRIVTTGLLNSHLTAFAGAGFKRNFLSQDSILRSGATYYWRESSVSASIQYTAQSIDRRSSLHPLVVDTDMSMLLTRDLIGSVVLEAAQDEQASVYSALLSIGYRINTRQATPIRDETPKLERIL